MSVESLSRSCIGRRCSPLHLGSDCRFPEALRSEHGPLLSFAPQLPVACLLSPPVQPWAWKATAAAGSPYSPDRTWCGSSGRRLAALRLLIATATISCAFG